MSSILAILSLPSAFLAGVASSPHCCLMCGPMQSLHLGAPGRDGLAGRLAALHAGRIATYTVLGMAAGAVGSLLLGMSYFAEAGYWLRIAAAVVLLALGLRALRAPASGCSKPGAVRRSGAFSFGIGLLWPLVPCTVLLGLLFAAAATGDALQSALIMTAFGLGTLPLLSALGVATGQRRSALSLSRYAGALLFVALGSVSLIDSLVRPAAARSPWCVTGFSGQAHTAYPWSRSAP